MLGTTRAAEQRTDVEVMAGYKGQAKAEGGFRFLKDPLFFVSSLFVKKPCRIQGLLMVMTLALLVYSVAQRRLRHALAGFDHGVGHPLLFLCDAKVPNYRKNKGFKVLGPYAEWPKVADAVIKAHSRSKTPRSRIKSTNRRAVRR